MTRFMKILLLVPLLLIVLPAPSYCEDNKHLSSVMLLLNSKPLMADIIAKVTTKFGSEVNAAVAILLSANQGYSWSQIIDAIEAGTLKADGSITGISPQRALSHQKTLSDSKQLVSTNKYTAEEIKAICLWYDAIYKDYLKAIAAAVCQNYTHNQIITALQNETLMHDGRIACSQEEKNKGLCIKILNDYIWKYEWWLIPDTKWKIRHFGDCIPRVTDPILIPKGCWENSYYTAIITDDQSGYLYIGLGPGFKHSGIITLQATRTYEGRLVDDPASGNFNYGDLTLEMLDSSTIRIKSKWYDPEGNPIKDTDWEKLWKFICD